jgi:hypothetical protein
MRKFVLTILFVFLFSGVALAGSNTYEGYPVINVKVDGQLVESDVPGIAINGTTLVPLRAISESMGSEIAYDAKTKTAIITSRQVVSNNDNEAEKVRAYVRAADSYHQLDELGRSISSLANMFEIVYNHYMLGTDPGVDIDTAFDAFNTNVNYYNEYLQYINKTIESSDLNLADMNTIMSNYSDAIDYFRVSLDSLEKLSVEYSKEDYNSYFSNGSTGMNFAHKGVLKAKEKYNYYINIAK